MAKYDTQHPPRNPQQMERTFYKLDVQGIVYLVDPATSKAYTYDLSNPTEIGKIVWTNPNTPPAIELLENWAAILQAKVDAQKA